MNFPCQEDSKKKFYDQKDSYKSGGVVVPGSFRVTESLKQRVCLDDLVLQRHLGVLLLALPGTDHGEVGDDLLGVLSLPRARLAT